MGYSVVFDTIQSYVEPIYYNVIGPVFKRENLAFGMILLTSTILAYQFIDVDTDGTTNQGSTESITDKLADMVPEMPEMPEMPSFEMPGAVAPKEEEVAEVKEGDGEPKLGGGKGKRKSRKRHYKNKTKKQNKN